LLSGLSADEIEELRKLLAKLEQNARSRKTAAKAG
jgi:hypothetical protein